MAQLTLQQAFDLAQQHHRAGRLAEAEPLYQTILEKEPAHLAALHYLGALAHQTGRHELSAELFQRAIAVQPNVPAAFNNLSISLNELGRWNEAIVAARQAISLKPDYAMAYNTLGNALHHAGKLDEAQAAYGRSIAIMPDNPQFHWNLAILLLARGEFPEGWEEFEWRTKRNPRLRRDFVSPQWNGEDLAGKTLLLHTEGGFGDALQFVRYITLIEKSASRMVLECQPQLVRLFSALPNIDAVIVRGDPLPAFDYHIPLQSLPRQFKTNLENIPHAVPYLNVPEDARARWHDRVQNNSRLKVGLAWAGSVATQIESEYRTRSLDIFAALAEVADVQFFSLQKGSEANLPVPAGLEMIDLTSDLTDFAETAALIEQLDLVISVDTSVAHLAGALAMPVWVLIPSLADFRWLLDRTDSPWYPTMRLFRQQRGEDWSRVMAEIKATLQQLAGRSG